MSNDELTPNQPQFQSQSMMVVNLANMTKYMRFLGLLAMIGGVIYSLTIVGAIIGIPYYIMGKRLRESAEAFTSYNSSSSARDLETAIEKQTKAFFIQYVLSIVALVILAISLVVTIVALASGNYGS